MALGALMMPQETYQRVSRTAVALGALMMPYLEARRESRSIGDSAFMMTRLLAHVTAVL